MSPKLMAAIRQRIEREYSRAQIKREVLAAGYTEDQFDTAYAQAEAAVGEQLEAGAAHADEEVVEAAEPASESAPPKRNTTPIVDYSTLPGDGLALLTSRLPAFLASLIPICFGAIIFALPALVPLAESLGLPLEVVWETDPWLLLGGVVVFYLIALMLTVAAPAALLRTLIRFDGDQNGYWGSLGWAFPRVISIIAVVVYMKLAILTGYLLLIIPGIAASVYLMFSLCALAAEDARGTHALISSIELVYGRWWSVLGRLILIMLLLVSFVLLTGLVGALPVVAAAFFSPAAAAATAAAIYALIGLVVGWWGIALGVSVYRSLRTVGPAVPLSRKTQQTLRTVLRGAMVIGFLALTVPPLLTFYFVSQHGGTDAVLEELFPEEFSLERLRAGDDSELDATVRETLTDLRLQASRFHSANGRTYNGLCDDLAIQSALDGLPGVSTCFDAAPAYALAAELPGSRGWWCVDSTFFSGKIASAPTGLICSPQSESETDTVPPPPTAETGGQPTATSTRVEPAADTDAASATNTATTSLPAEEMSPDEEVATNTATTSP